MCALGARTQRPVQYIILMCTVEPLIRGTAGLASLEGISFCTGGLQYKLALTESSAHYLEVLLYV